LQDVILYRAVAEDDAMEVFYVDPNTGRVTIKKMLYPGSKTSYTVSKTVKMMPEMKTVNVTFKPF
jgi:hypothetical protein